MNPDKPSRRSVWIAAGVIAAALAIAYANSFRGAFVLDDLANIERNERIRRLWPPWELLSLDNRPVVTLSLALNYHFGGLRLPHYHAANLAIHLAAAMALFAVLRRTLLLPRFRGRFERDASLLALSTALLWALHPLQTESVTYLIQRAEAMAGLFLLLTLYAVIRGAAAERPRRWYVAAVLFCAVGMGCKEVLVAAPPVVLLYDRVFLADSWRQLWRARWGLYVGLASTLLLAAPVALLAAGGESVSVGRGVAEATPITYLLTQPEVILHYLRLVFWPDDLCLLYCWPIRSGLWEALPAAVAVLALLLATAALLVRRSPLGLAGAWFFLILAPTSSVVPLKDAAFEHRMYLPLAAPLVLAVLAVYEGGRRALALVFVSPELRRRAGLAAGGLLLAVAAAALGARTWVRNADYRTQVAILEDNVARVPGSWLAWNNLAVLYLAEGRREDAFRCFDRVVALRPTDATMIFNRGKGYADANRFEEAIRDFDRSIELRPAFPEAYFNRANAWSDLNRLPEAVRDYDAAIRLKPDYGAAYYNRAIAHFRAGQRGKALDDVRQFQRLGGRPNPDFLKALGQPSVR